MSKTKQRIVDFVEGLPDDSSYDEILRELAFHRMVEKGLADSEAKRTVDNEEMRHRIRSWVK